jgi:class 3 adenylate cyclase/TolB-like protein
MLQLKSLTISEISHQLGFSSTSYFIKCFRDQFGYPPGEMAKKHQNTRQSAKPSQKHQLAAIMFTDIEGYTALMQQDEAKALETRNRHRTVFEAATAKNNGKILQYYGDGTLSTFSSAIDAVRCGIELQLSFGEEPKIPVRVGIHTGDILFSDDGIVGDGVNVASRIESLAVAQSVFISEKVYDEVKNQVGIETTSMGVFELKNVDKPIEVFAITNPGLTVPLKNQVSGKVKDARQQEEIQTNAKDKKAGLKWMLLPLAVVVLGFVLYFSDSIKNVFPDSSFSDTHGQKISIAVLPFINDSSDSSNVYLINGLMESTLTNLQQIKDLRVLSRTSVEKYRRNPKSTPEIAKELDVIYLIEGSGQKIGDQIMLHIQLIDARIDQHIWSGQYTRKATDIFALQQEIAKNITNQIEVIITPEEEKRINTTSTDDPVAYDYLLKGLDLLNTRIPENLLKSITYFKMAIEQDPDFARAYAAITMAYYFLDSYQIEKKYTEQINYFADQAMLNDSELPQSLIAKGLYYMSTKEYDMSVSFFEKALEFNPNYDLVFIFLVDLYVNYIPNTEKYLEYALKGLEIDALAYDSSAMSISYLHISNAFVQSGFVEEAVKYIDVSIAYDPNNLYSKYTKAYILFARNRDLKQTLDLLLDALKKDTTRIDIMQEVGKIYYYMRDYKNAYKYYKQFIDIKEVLKLSIYQSENAKIALVWREMGLTDQANKFISQYREYAENDQSVYQQMSLSIYHAYNGNTDKALEHLELFSKQENYFYWTLLFTPIDPLVDSIKETSEFKKIMKDIENNFNEYHKEMRRSLQQKGVI